MDQAKRLFTSARFALRGLAERRVPYKPDQAIRQRQTRNLRRVVSHALRTVPFYRDAARSGELGVSEPDIASSEDLTRLPLIDGTCLQTDPRRFVSTALPIQSLVEFHSTGTAAYGAKSVFWTESALMSEIAYGERDRSVLRHLLGATHGLVRLSFFHPDSSTSMASRF